MNQPATIATEDQPVFEKTADAILDGDLQIPEWPAIEKGLV